MKKWLMILVLVALIPMLQGCAIALLTAGAGYAIGQGRKGSAQVLEAKAKYTEKYNTYRVELEKVNLEREKAGLKPTTIPTFEEWLEIQPLTSSEIKLFQRYKAQNVKELKENIKKEETK